MKGAIRSMPASPVIQPIRKEPTKSTMDPLSKISRISPSSISPLALP